MLKFFKKNAFLLISGIFVATLAILGLNSFTNPDKTQKFLGFAGEKFLIPGLLIQLFLRLKWRAQFRPLLKKLALLVLVCLVLLVTGLSIFWAHSYENAVYELTRLHPQGLTLMLVFTALSLLINQARSWWQKYYTRAIFVFPLLTFGLLYLVSLWPFNIFKEIVKEDRLIEYAQFFVLLIGSVVSFLQSLRFFGQKQWLRATFYALASLALFFVAGDEISWGQRILGLESGAALQEINRQGELTVHNLYAVEWLVIYAYVAMSALGVAAYWLTKLSKPLNRYTSLVPSWILGFYFAFALLYFVQQLRIKWGIWHSWSEVAELSLYLGLVWWVILLDLPELANYKSKKLSSKKAK